MHLKARATGIFFALALAAPAFAAQQDVTARTKSDMAYNAQWDRCEALAKQRGTPPGKVGYGDFMDACMGKASISITTGAAPINKTLPHE